MKNIFKIIAIFIIIMLSTTNSYAFSINKLDKLIKKSNINETSTIAISIKNVNSDFDIYSYNKNKLLHPASTLKIFTAYSSLEELGYDYQFKTQLYKDKKNNLYIKLGADPLLTTAQLKQAFQKLKADGFSTFNNLYFDDSILDKKEFAQGWMWDDDINPYTPKVSSYNLDSNVLNITISSNDITLKPNYTTSIRSNIKSGEKFDFINIERYNWLNPELIEITGSIKDSRTIKIPISSMRRYFIYNIGKILEENKIEITGTLYASKIVPDGAELIGEITNPISNTLAEILHNSNNLMAETIFKLAAVKKYNATGSDELGAILFNDYFEKLGQKNDTIIIKDGCGVSRKNLITADWITSALNKIYKSENFEKFKDNMAQPGDGTLSSRLYELRGNAWLKTGSLSNISAIAGFIHSMDGNTYSIAILIQNFNLDHKDIKNFEDNIIAIIYNH